MLLSELQNNEVKNKFVGNVSEGIQENLKRQVKTNTGIKNSNDLKSRILNGDKISFDYKVLVKDSENL